MLLLLNTYCFYYESSRHTTEVLKAYYKTHTTLKAYYKTHTTLKAYYKTHTTLKAYYETHTTQGQALLCRVGGSLQSLKTHS